MHEAIGDPKQGKYGHKGPKGNKEHTGMGQGLHQFSDFCEFAWNLFFKGVLGQSSLPICVLGTIEFIWAGGIPLKPLHEIIPPQNNLFWDHLLSQWSLGPLCVSPYSPLWVPGLPCMSLGTPVPLAFVE